MDSKQESKLSMYLATKDTLNATTNSTIVAALPSFSGYNTQFNTNVTALHNTRVLQEASTKGFGVNKKELRDDLIVKAYDVACKVKAYATVNNISVLIEEVGYSKSKFERAPDTILRDMTQLIYNRANSNSAALVSFGVTAANLTALQTAITAYLASIPKPRTGIVTRKQATQQLADLFASTDLLLEKMDVIVNTVKLSNLVFWKNYFDARMIIDSGSSKLSLRGKVTDKLNSEVLSGVVIILKGKEIKIKTTAKGNFSVKSLAAGRYTLVFSKNGYKNFTMTADITDNERTEVAVEMEKN